MMRGSYTIALWVAAISAAAVSAAQANQLSSPGSTMVQCQRQLGPNSSWYSLAQGQTITVGCTSSAPASTVTLNPNATILVRCGSPGSNNSWTPLKSGQQVTLTCGSGPSPTPTPTGTPTATSTPTPKPTPSASPSIPSGVPTPPAIQSIPPLKNPITIKPGANVNGYVIYGDGVTDDTAGIQAALNSSDILVAPATYAIGGNVTIPTWRNISCQSGAIFLDTQDLTTRMFQIGYSSSSIGNNSIVGCTLQGTDFVVGSPGSFANYRGGTSGYSELLEIASGWGLHTNNVLIENDTFSDAQGDALLTYSPCGTNNIGSACNDGSPGTEGPSNISIVNSTVEHCSQPGFHLNGGQNIVVEGNTSIDCVDDDEVDSNVLQVMTTWWYNNKFTTKYGWLDPQNNQMYGPWHSCTGDDLIPENDSGCWSFDNNIDGTSNYGPTVLLEPSGCPGGGGHYLNESLSNGAQLSNGC